MTLDPGDASAATTCDGFLGGRISALQPASGHRSGTDAVFLAAAAMAEGEGAGLRVLDAGAGVGVAGLCLLARVPGISVTAVDSDAASCLLAKLNGERNGFADRFEAIEADLTAPGKTLAAAGLEAGCYDILISNPPFYPADRVRAGKGRDAAHVMPEGGLEAWARFLAHMAAPQAVLTLIHRPDALQEILQALEGRFGGIVVFPLFPRRGEPASRILVQGRKGSRAPMTLRRGLILHEENGAYTETAEAILRHAAALSLV